MAASIADSIVFITDFAGNTNRAGTGVLISPDEVLTSAALVQGGAIAIAVTPGADSTASSYATTAGSWYEVIGDLALIHLNTPYFNLRWMDPSPGFAGGLAMVSAFPAGGGSRVDSLQWVGADGATAAVGGTIGGPVWDGASVFAITQAGGTATLINATLLTQIQAVLQQDDYTVGAVYDTATALAARFDTLEQSARNNQLVSITATDGGSLPLTLAQLVTDRNALRFVTGSVTVEVAAGLRGHAAALSTLGETGISNIRFIDGTLTFDVNSASAQVLRLYQAALGRTPDQTGLQFWTDRLEGGMRLDQLAQGFVAGGEFQARVNAADPAALVGQLYTATLHRAADAEGLAFWTGMLGQGMSQAAMVTAFSESAENRAGTLAQVKSGLWNLDSNAAAVARMYDTALNRLPDAAGLATWTALINQGAVTLTALAEGFAHSAEFLARTGALSNWDFVTGLYVDALDSRVDPAGRWGWVQALNAGTLDRAGVLVGFSESAQHQALMAGKLTPDDPAKWGIPTG